MTTVRTRAATSALALAVLAAAQDALDPSTLSPGERQVYDLLRSLETGDRGALAVVDPESYVQNNLGAGDGLAGMEAFLDALPPETTRANPVRIVEDGNHVFAHGEYDIFGPKIFGPKVSLDVFRFEGDRIVEHWDNLQELEGPNPSGHTMTDEPPWPPTSRTPRPTRPRAGLRGRHPRQRAHGPARRLPRWQRVHPAQPQLRRRARRPGRGHPRPWPRPASRSGSTRSIRSWARATSCW